MTTEPRTQEDIYESLRDSLTGKIAKLSNFTERSFNYIWTQAFADEVRGLEVFATVSQLVGLIDYSGGPVDGGDLEALGIGDSVSAEEINDLMQDDYLDEFVKIVGVQRFEGARATGEVTIDTTADSVVTIPEGTVVSTSPDSDGSTINFETTASAGTTDSDGNSPNTDIVGSTPDSVSGVPIQAAEVGPDHKLPADSIVRFADPPIGVKSVNNPAATTGGEDRETNEELRERAKTAIEGAAEGGTAAGIQAYISRNVEGVRDGDVVIDEFVDQSPPYVDVIVDGGDPQDVLDAIAYSRPTGIRHTLVQPQNIQVGVDLELVGQDISTGEVEEEVEDHLLNLGLGDNLYRDALIRTIMESDRDILNIDLLNEKISRVTNERFTYDSTQTDYRLDFTFESDHGEITIADSDGFEYTREKDYTLVDQTGDDWPETIVWDTNNNTPDDGELFTADYDVTTAETTYDNEYTTDLVRDEIHTFETGTTSNHTYSSTTSKYQLDDVPFDGTESITDNSGDTYTAGTDYAMFDYTGNGFQQTVDWDHIYLDGAVADDGGTTTDETSEASDHAEDDMTLLPSDPAVDDAYYFGSNSTFGTVELNISTTGDGTWDIAWEYYDGTNWVALSNVTDDTDAFRSGGERDVSWTIPGDWSTTAVGGISGLYWVRARVTSFTEILQQPLGRRASKSAPGSTPDNDEDFTVTYDKKVYLLEYEVVDTPKGEIKDQDGDLYEQDVDYDITDYDLDKENEAFVWFNNPSTLSDGDEFYVTYLTEGDLHIDDREKVGPGAIYVEVG